MLSVTLDVGGSSVKAAAHGEGTGPGRGAGSGPLPLRVSRPSPTRAEVDPVELEQLCRTALAQVAAPLDAAELLGLTVSTLRQGFVLLDAAGEPLGPVVLNSDRRGASYAHVLAVSYATTGHWPAPELTLPKLLAIRDEEPERWARARRVLFLHDWLLYRLTGQLVTEASYACSGGMADVAARDWAFELLAEHGVERSLLSPVVEAGTLVGELVDGWPLPAGLPVVAGCADTQLAAMGVGGLADGVVTVVAGSSTPVQIATAAPLADPLEHPWVSTHAAPDRWAAEGNAGYPGTVSGWWESVVGHRGTGPKDRPVERQPGLLAVTAAPHWSQQSWQHRPPTSLLGLQPDTTAEQVRTALLDAHAYAVRGNVEDLERALGRQASAVVVCGGAAGDGRLPARIAEVLGRDVHWGQDPDGAVRSAGHHLIAKAVGAHSHAPVLTGDVLPAGDPSAHAEPYERWREAYRLLQP